MMLSELLLLPLLFQAYPGDSSIDGVVLNGSANRAPVADAEVVLRARLDGEFQPVAETTSDDQGHFSFEQLPTDEAIVYLPGANRDGVHYPGKRVSPSPRRPNTRVELTVYDVVEHPCPLVIEHHEIEICPAPGVLKVREVLVIANPASRTYVGQPAQEMVDADADPVTLRLAIPSDFERITFDKEFFGRQFSVLDAALVTRIPWTPGRKELAFTYLLRNESHHRLIERPLDLPCSRLRVRVLTDRPAEVACTLGVDRATQRHGVVFESEGQALPAGHVIGIELGRLPVSWIAFGRPVAAGALVALIAATVLVMKHQLARRASE